MFRNFVFIALLISLSFTQIVQASATAEAATTVPVPAHLPAQPQSYMAFGAEVPDTFRPRPIFAETTLRPGVERVGYLSDTCQVLAARYAPDSSDPNTIVVPVMLHGIFPALGADDLPGKNITVDDFNAVMDMAHDLGFQTITTAELLDFLYFNKRIPARSLYLIFDDRFPDSDEQYALPKLQEYGWTAVLAWISTETTGRQWGRLQGLLDTGRFELQSHSHEHLYMHLDTPIETVRSELSGPIETYQTRFGVQPQVHVWPGGHFTPVTAEVAEELGYELGFTVYPRGPLMFNSIPLGAEERTVANPLLVLPRYWPTFGVGQFRFKLEQAIAAGEAAQVFALEHRAEDLHYLNQVCGLQAQPLPIVKSTLAGVQAR